jgi:prefoldin subunit 5
MTDLMVDKQVVITQANAAIKEYNSQVKDLRNEQNALQSDLDTLNAQLTDTLNELTRTLIPNLNQETMDDVSTVFGLNVAEWYGMKVQLNDINLKLIEDIEASEDYNNLALQTEPTSGTLSVQYRETDQLIQDINLILSTFTNHPNFREFFNSRSPGLKRKNSLMSMFDPKAKRLNALLDFLGFSDFESLMLSYDSKIVDKETLTTDLATTRAEIMRLQAIGKNHVELKAQTDSFEKGILYEVQNYVNGHIQRTESLVEIRESCNPTVRLLITTVIALKAKLDILGKSFTVLNREILNLNKNKNAIQDQLIQWTRSKNRTLKDKSKQLVNGPAKYKLRTNSIVNSSGYVRYDTVHYVDYNHYDNNLSIDSNIPFWDIVNSHNTNSVPVSNILLQDIIPNYSAEAYQDYEPAVGVSESEVDDTENLEDFNFSEDKSEVLEEEPEVIESSSDDNNDDDNSSDDNDDYSSDDSDD